MVEQKARELHVSAVRGLVERCEPALLAGVHVRAGGDDEPRERWLRTGQRRVDSGHVELVAGMGIDLGAARKQELDRRLAAEETGQSEWLKAVV
jgi:hypothetical protein